MLRRLLVSTLFSLAVLQWAEAIGEDDLVVNLPGLIFQTTFNTYAGYLNANADGSWQMHYMLTESRSDPTTDPILVWFNGGPGCSSFAGAFEELGPFYVNKDGNSLYENVYSWNQKANVLYLESPIGVSFSYAKNISNYTTANDFQTAQQNYAALADFFARVQTKYQNRTFFLSGESYAGVYIPMLADLLVQGINNKSFPNPNFQGAAIGNGFMNVRLLMNSVILWSNYHGRISLDDWDTIKSTCCQGVAVDDCDFSKYFTSKNGIDYTSDGTVCGNLIAPWIILPDNMDQYNFYQDCYDGTAIEVTSPLLQRVHHNSFYAQMQDVSSASGNTANTLNQDSTDNQWGYPCWNEASLYTWANKREVQKALHVADEWMNKTDDNGNPYPFTDCNDALYNSYFLNVSDTTDYFVRILNNVTTPNFRFLIYNGDVDTVCNYLGDAWHIRNVVNKVAGFTSEKRDRWWFRNQTAGFVQRYAKNGLTIDVLTVKGAGHFVPNDRPGPGQQMITNFMFPPANPASAAAVYNYTGNTPAPLLSQGNDTTLSSSTVTGTTSTGTATTSTGTATTSTGTATTSTGTATTTAAPDMSATFTFLLAFVAILFKML